MNLVSAKSRLAALSKELQSRWQNTRESWRDEKGAEFEQRFIEELMGTVNTTLSNMDRLEQTISRIRKDCE